MMTGRPHRPRRVLRHSVRYPATSGLPVALPCSARRPGRDDWLIWVALLPLGMLAAYTGTILPDDMLSGGSLSVITGVLLSVPVIGTHLVFWIFGGRLRGIRSSAATTGCTSWSSRPWPARCC